MNVPVRWSLVTFALCSSAWAEAPPNIAPVPSALDDVQQARNYAMGGAYHSLGLGTEAIEGNPATMSLFKRYQVELGGAWDIPNGMAFGGLSVMDSASSDLAMGVSYQLLTFNSPYGQSTAHLTTLGVAYPITDWLHIGVSGRNQIIDGPYSTNSITVTAGIALRIYDLVVLGFTGANLIPVNSPLVNRYFALSLAGNFGLFSPSVEVKADFNAPFPALLVRWRARVHHWRSGAGAGRLRVGQHLEREVHQRRVRLLHERQRRRHRLPARDRRSERQAHRADDQASGRRAVDRHPARSRSTRRDINR